MQWIEEWHRFGSSWGDFCCCLLVHGCIGLDGAQCCARTDEYVRRRPSALEAQMQRQRSVAWPNRPWIESGASDVFHGFPVLMCSRTRWSDGILSASRSISYMTGHGSEGHDDDGDPRGSLPRGEMKMTGTHRGMHDWARRRMRGSRRGDGDGGSLGRFDPGRRSFPVASE